MRGHRPKQDEDSGEWRYYVHYEGFNRRLDEWVPLERFDLGSQTEDGKMAGEGARGGGTRRRASSIWRRSRSTRRRPR